MDASTLLDAFSQRNDHWRGVRHPFPGIGVLMLLGMLTRIRELEVGAGTHFWGGSR